MIRRIKKFFSFLSATPFHPQWFCSKSGNQLRSFIVREITQGVIVDIGCSKKWPQEILSQQCRYIGLDYPETSHDWYKTVPDVYGDGHYLPFKNKSVDYVLLLDVLEHLSDTDQVMVEIRRILKDNGSVIIQTPFLYPIHDAPRDFYRWTVHGLRELAAKHNYIISGVEGGSLPIETAAVTSNIAMVKTALNWFEKKKIASIFLFAVPFYVLINNILSWIVAKGSVQDGFMPLNYRMVWHKQL